MSDLILRWLFQGILTLTLFSYWAAFALLVVNRFFYKDLPGYTIGRICIWELVAIIIAAMVSHLMIKKWGNIERRKIDNETRLVVNPKFGTYFAIYFLIAVIIGTWEFYRFSQQF